MKHLRDLDEFNELLRSSGDALVVIDFTATWCGPCKMMSPLFEAMEKEEPQVVFAAADVDEASDIAAHCQIRSMPTFHLYQFGSLVDSFSGADAQRLRAIISHLRFRHFDVLPPTTRVRIQGLSKAPEHNGKEARVLGFDGSRYNCRLDTEDVIALRPEKVRATRVPARMGNATVSITGYDEATHEYSVVDEAGGSRTASPSMVLLDAGTRVRTVHLSDAARNDVRGKILAFDDQSGRYSVLVKGDGTQWKVKPENVVCS